MVCLGSTPEANFIDPDEWPFPDLLTGLIPIIWSSGSYIKELQDSNPWMGLLIPDRFEWHGASLDIYFFSNARALNGCWLNFPATRVRISMFCSQGFHQMFIEVTSGNRWLTRNLWNIPGDWQIFNDFTALDNSASRCSEKYYDRNKLLAMDLRVIAEWIQLMRDYAVTSNGTAPLWYQQIIDNADDDDIGLKDICEGCLYGLLPNNASSGFTSLEQIRGSYDKLTGFPVNEGDFGYIDTCSNSLIVVNAIEYTYTIYKSLQALCYIPILIVGRGELKPECVKVEDDDDRPLPSDDDPRWISQCGPESKSCDVNYVRSSNTFSAEHQAYGIGKYAEGAHYNVSLSQVPAEFIPVSPDKGPPPGSVPHYPVESYILVCYQIIRNRMVLAVDGATGNCSQFFIKEIETIRLEEFVSYALDENGNRTPESIENGNKENAYYAAFHQKWLDNRTNCEFNFNDPNNFPPPPPPVIERNERKDKDGKCYISGQIFIGLLGSMEKKIRIGKEGDLDRIQNIVAPVVRAEVTQALGVPTGITIPFKFQLPTGKTSLGTVSVNIIGTALIAVTFGNIEDQILINLEEIFAYYNFAQQVLGFLIPGKVMILNLKAFCE